MPSHLHTDNSLSIGQLYVVASPIGNLEDITFRAVRVLSEVDLIASEDTRHTQKLLNHYKIKTKITSYHEHNERKKAAGLVVKLTHGASIALVTDAGTPSISDPGYRLVKEAIQHNVPIIPLPGASAALTALCASGLPTDTFTFYGFLDKKKTKRHQQLETALNTNGTAIFYESPHRIVNLIQEIKSIAGDLPAVLSRELTKVHEEFLRGNLSNIFSILKKRRAIKGECTLLVYVKQKPIEIDTGELKQKITELLEKGNHSLAMIAKKLSLESNISRNRVYQEALNICQKKQ